MGNQTHCLFLNNEQSLVEMEKHFFLQKELNTWPYCTFFLFERKEKSVISALLLYMTAFRIRLARAQKGEKDGTQDEQKQQKKN